MGPLNSTQPQPIYAKMPVVQHRECSQ